MKVQNRIRTTRSERKKRVREKPFFSQTEKPYVYSKRTGKQHKHFFCSLLSTAAAAGGAKPHSHLICVLQWMGEKNKIRTKKYLLSKKREVKNRSWEDIQTVEVEENSSL